MQFRIELLFLSLFFSFKFFLSEVEVGGELLKFLWSFEYFEFDFDEPVHFREQFTLGVPQVLLSMSLCDLTADSDFFSN